MNERWKEHLDQDIAFHRKTAAIYDHVNIEPRMLATDLLFAPFERHVVPGATMLDLGCGTGQMLLRYASRFRRAVGVDHSPEMLDLARRRVPEVAAGRCTLVNSDLLEFLGADRDRYALVSCVGCLHHLPGEAFDVFFRLARGRLEQNGLLLLAEPVDTGGRAPPPPVARWNARSVMATRAALMPMEESDEAPIAEEVLLLRPADCGLRRVAVSRGWELFQRCVPASLLDRITLRFLHGRYGSTGNVVAALWQAA